MLKVMLQLYSVNLGLDCWVGKVDGFEFDGQSC